MNHLNSTVAQLAAGKDNGTLGDLLNDGPGGFIAATLVVLLVAGVLVGLAKLSRGRKNKG